MRSSYPYEQAVDKVRQPKIRLRLRLRLRRGKSDLYLTLISISTFFIRCGLARGTARLGAPGLGG